MQLINQFLYTLKPSGIEEGVDLIHRAVGLLAAAKASRVVLSIAMVAAVDIMLKHFPRRIGACGGELSDAMHMPCDGIPLIGLKLQSKFVEELDRAKAVMSSANMIELRMMTAADVVKQRDDADGVFGQRRVELLELLVYTQGVNSQPSVEPVMRIASCRKVVTIDQVLTYCINALAIGPFEQGDDFGSCPTF